MYYIKSLPPKFFSTSWNYSRFGVFIPKDETKIEKLKDLFIDSPLSEEKLLKAMREDDRVVIESIEDKEKRIKIEKQKKEKTPEAQLEKKIIRINKTQRIQDKLRVFNEEKENAMATPGKEDDKIVEAKEKELEKEIAKIKKELEE